MSDGGPALESALQRLEAIVTRLERDDLELDEALRLFEEGVTHLRTAQQILTKAELEIERLIEEKGKVIQERMPPGAL